MIDVGSAGFQNFSPLYFHAAAEQAARETGAREPVVPPAESSSSNNTGASGSERERARGDSSSQVQGSWYTPSDAEGGESSYAVNERQSDDCAAAQTAKRAAQAPDLIQAPARRSAEAPAALSARSTARSSPSRRSSRSTSSRAVRRKSLPMSSATSLSAGSMPRRLPTERRRGLTADHI